MHLPYKLGLVSIESISDLHSPFLVVVLAQECWECKLGINWCHNDGGNSVEFLSEAFFVRINSNVELILRSKNQENHDFFSEMLNSNSRRPLKLRSPKYEYVFTAKVAF